MLQENPSLPFRGKDTTMKHILLTVLAFFTLAGCGEQKDPNTLVMGTNAEFPPFEMRGGPDGEGIVGFDPDVARLIAVHAGKKLQIEDMKFDSLIPALNTGKIDMILAGMTVTEDRRRNVDFSDPYYKVTQIVLIQAKDAAGIRSLDDLKNKKIAVAIGTTGDTAASQYTPNVIRFNTAFEAVMELKNGKVDLILTDEALGSVLHAKNPELARVDLPFEDEYYAVAVRKGNTELLERINESLKKIRNSGEMDILLEKHFTD